MSAKATARAARSLWLVSMSLIAVTIAFQLAASRGHWGANDTVTIIELLAFLAPATCGALIAAHHPRNAIGWLFILVTITWVGGLFFATAFSRTIVPNYPPGWDWIIWVIQSFYLPAIVATVTYLFLLFPDGALPGRRWRPLVWLTALLVIWIGVDEAVTNEYLITEPPISNPAHLPAADAIFRHFLIELGITTLFAVVVLLSASALFLRFRDARGITRQQLKWFALPTIVIAVVIFVAMSSLLIGGDGYFSLVHGIVQGSLLIVATLLPVSVGIAIVRHNLYDIDLIINRAIVYTILSLSLGLVYFTTVVGGGSLLRSVSGETSSLLVAVSTLLIAALFRPFRTVTQNMVDRRFYRQRYDAQRTLRSFGVTARDAVDLDQLTAELTGVISTTIQPAHVSIWLRAETAEGDRI